MKFTATENQVAQIGANAVNAATPMGMGILHFKPKMYTADEVKRCIIDTFGLSIDYFEGRMTKLYIRREGDSWIVDDERPRGDYQSWVHKYPTYEALVRSVIATDEQPTA